MAALRLWRAPKAFTVVGALAASLALIAGCGSSSKPSTAGNASSGSSAKTLKVVLAWYPTPEYGGLYAALDEGYFTKEGLNVEVKPGGPQVSSTQVVGSGQAEIGYLNNDETLMQARQDGIELTEFATTYEKYPEGLEYQSSHPISNLAEANGKTISMVTGSVDYEWLQHKYGLKNPTTPYSYATFGHDPTSLLLGYVSDDIPTLAAQGIKASYVPISESGLNPYADVIFAKSSYVQANGPTLKKFLAAVARGWQYYRSHYEQVNKTIFKAEPNTPLSTDNAISKAQEPFIYGGAAETTGIGSIEEARVKDTYEKLRSLKVITKSMSVEQIANTALGSKLTSPAKEGS